MPRGEKFAYDQTGYDQKHKREARHIETSYTKHGASSKRAERIAWATVNKQDGDGKKSH
jgi:hypothetical protein